MNSPTPEVLAFSNVISNLIPFHKHCHQRKILQGSFSCQYVTSEGAVFINAPLDSVFTTRSLGSGSGNTFDIDIYCNPTYQGTSNISRIQLFVFHTGSYEVLFFRPDGSEITSRDFTTADNRTCAKIENIMLQTH